MADFSYIVLDLEWNQPLNPDSAIREPFFFDSEIIEIGALRLDERFRETGSFKTFIRPRFYPHMNGDVVQLTKIRAQDLEKAPEFPRAYADFMEWCGGGLLPVYLGTGRHPGADGQPADARNGRGDALLL